MLCCFRYTSWCKGGNGGPRSPWTSHGCPEREKWAIFVLNHLFELGYSDFPPKHTSFKETTDPFPSGFFYRIVVKISFQSSSTVCQEEKNQLWVTQKEKQPEFNKYIDSEKYSSSLSWQLRLNARESQEESVEERKVLRRFKEQERKGRTKPGIWERKTRKEGS